MTTQDGVEARHPEVVLLGERDEGRAPPGPTGCGGRPFVREVRRAEVGRI